LTDKIQSDVKEDIQPNVDKLKILCDGARSHVIRGTIVGNCRVPFRQIFNGRPSVKIFALRLVGFFY
jgi:hypothetical protein